MHKEILTVEQKELSLLVESFAKDFGLVGGTAIALHLGHRHSIDFDLFTDNSLRNQSILNKILKNFKIDLIIVNKLDELTFILKGVKFTFFRYPYVINYEEKLGKIKIPDLLTLSAMKAYALGRRAKWKDYVDLYFITKDYHSIAQICARAKKIFGAEFNEKIFREQLSYFDDIDYSEAVDYLPGFEVRDSKIKKALIEISLAE
ncbi:nucleotidyl transferase AbiEii/AbiGii toxin family protein [Patescibacteria group bacterium]|nr:nucleotidyl transferase AbiEii/AbiGii toxin family protein [Patescibacteria group bacterium]